MCGFRGEVSIIVPLMHSIKTILVVGLGSIGKRHLANLMTLYPDAQFVVLRHSRLPQNEAQPVGNINTVYDINLALAYRPDIAVICSPASEHVAIATILAQHGVHLFIEKPISNHLTGVDELIQLCEQNKLVLMIGYTLRFLPSLQQFVAALKEGCVGKVYYAHAMVGQYLPDWRPNADYRQSVSAQQVLGGGVLLELSHEIDYLTWLFGVVCSVQGYAQRLSTLEIDVEDSADAILCFASGVVAHVHMDMFQRHTVRHCRVVGSDGTLIWDGMKHSVMLHKSDIDTIVLFEPPLPHQRNDIYMAHIQHFVACVLGQAQPFTSASEARHTLEIVTAIKEAAQTGGTVQL